MYCRYREVMATGPVLVIAGAPGSVLDFRGALLKTIRIAGHQVIVAAPGLCQTPLVANELAVAGIHCVDIPLRRTGMNPLEDARLIISLYRLMRGRKPGVILAYTAKAVVFGLLAGALAGVPRRYGLITGLGYAFTGRATGRRALVQILSRMLYWVASRCATKLFFQNADDVSLFRQMKLMPPRLPTVVLNGSGIDLEQFRPAPFPNGPTKFLLAARLLATKGIREYAAAAYLVRKCYPNAEFHLVGPIDSNPDALAIREVEQWQKDGTLIWRGHMADIRPCIAECHVYVLPSYREGTPRSVLEAMAMGRPVITSDAPGCRETVIHKENGFLVAARSVEPLAQAMIKFIEVPNLITEMGTRSRELAERKYNVVEVNARMMCEMGLN